ncbi:MAG: hypothetical protein M3Z05_14165, partial [Gemmatimonadota bacterium]|nr:hypothetical protein [Gemmatimonadota bacterium]
RGSPRRPMCLRNLARKSIAARPGGESGRYCLMNTWAAPALIVIVVCVTVATTMELSLALVNVTVLLARVSVPESDVVPVLTVPLSSVARKVKLVVNVPAAVIT